MATHSSVIAWRIPGMGEPGGLPSMGSHRVGHDWSDLAASGYDKVLHKPPNFIWKHCIYIYAFFFFFSHLTMLTGCSGLRGSSLLCCPITSFSIVYLYHPWESSPPASSQQKEKVYREMHMGGFKGHVDPAHVPSTLFPLVRSLSRGHI